ncbi:unnamed protein product [Cuscuta epithymum]|uniref:Ubiquitin-like protease family profile domain-containing protein n=1 Tax=Cuscuta epithymum TaxID=186058 RepID=A0AAV0E4F3_9ASTE|nr:unnamed protein product [Cuscuta epithymum]CAH9116472.1 unnamed protein product [Cuscuta epithymum]CAH9148322.1 unnamed protein product [Cuscuta epithymum]
MEKKFWSMMLDVGGWLESQHFDEYLSYLRKRVLDESLSDVVVTTEFFSSFIDTNMDPKQELFPGLLDDLNKMMEGTSSTSYIKSWTGVKRLYFPHNIAETHWMAVRADFENNELVVFDSLRCFRSDDEIVRSLEPHRKWFGNVACILNGIVYDPEIMPLWNVKRPTVPQQTTSDCGVFTMKFIELDMVGKDFKELENMTESRMKQVRLLMAYSICKEFQETLNV